MKHFIVVISILVLYSSVFGQGKGLSVSPGGLLVEEVLLDSLYNMEKRTGIKLSITNKDTMSHTYTIRADKPSNLGISWLKGYFEIPDPSFLSFFHSSFFSEGEVTIGPKSTEGVNMYVKVPYAEKYYNQKWAVGIAVETKPEPEKGVAFALAVYPCIYIETEVKAKAKGTPYGEIGTKPGTVVLNSISPGRNKNVGKLRIYNNQKKKRGFKITSIIPPPSREKLQILNSPGYQWIPDAGWLIPSCEKLVIKANKSKEISLTLILPPDKIYSNNKYQGIIFIEPEDGGRPAFIRVNIETGE